MPRAGVKHNRTILITGGAGFIGSAFVRVVLAAGYRPVVLDALTYAGSLEHLAEVSQQMVFVKGRIQDTALVAALLAEHQPWALVNLAAETHVDNSITASTPFVETNVVGVHVLLEAARAYWSRMDAALRQSFRFLQVSTDEVFGDAGAGEYFSETSPYKPSSPYSASKAAADHLVMAWYRTYGLPTLITHCTNNYGPRQHAEKFIPNMLRKALAGEAIPIYGDGLQERDWLYVDDHARGILATLERGISGERYCFGGNQLFRNLDLAQHLCALLDRRYPSTQPHARLITHVADRPGHDRRYAMDASYAARQLGWKPQVTLHDGLAALLDYHQGQPM